MTEQTGFTPDPEANRAAWLAAHPEAQQASQAQAAAQVAANLGGSAPDPGVSGDQLGQQMAAAGAQAGLPHEQVMDDEMAKLRAAVEAMGADLARIRVERQQERAAAIAALGEPILQRYANAVRDHLKATLAANPAGAEHFAGVIGASEKLSDVAADTISKGANDLGQVLTIASQIDRFISRGHVRTAPHMLRQVDLSTVQHHLDYLVEEAGRLSGQLALA